MKLIIADLSLVVVLFVVSSCSSGQANDTYLLSPAAFSAKLKELNSGKVVDVRTPGEFAKGHLQNAKNIDWNGDDFEEQISLLDKNKPVFVYCLSGGRSASAATKMRSLGFVQVYELDGGITKWRSAGFSETAVLSNEPTGMSATQFEALLISDKLVLIDFYTPWCAPCKKMKPYLDELGEEMKDKVIIHRIDADENQILFKDLKLEILPTLLLYKNKTLVWSYTGYISKEEIAKQLK